MCRDMSHMFIFGPFFFFYCIFFLITNLFIIIYSLVMTTIKATASTTHFPSLSTIWLVTGGINKQGCAPYRNGCQPQAYGRIFLVFKPVTVRMPYHDSSAVYHKNTVRKVAFVDAEHQKNFRKLNRSCIWLLYAKMITNMPLRTYETYYLDYPFSNRKFTAVFLTSQRLHGTGTVPIP